MRADPPVRPDGLCACGCGKPLLAGPPKTMAKHMRAAFVREFAADPFASSGCARRFHGCELAPSRSTAWDNPETAARMRATQRESRALHDSRLVYA